jgi:hypothetical protein
MSQGIHEKNKPGEDLDRKIPAIPNTNVAQLPLTNVTHNKTHEQDDWKKDIQEMSKAIKGLVEAQVIITARLLHSHVRLYASHG